MFHIQEVQHCWSEDFNFILQFSEILQLNKGIFPGGVQVSNPSFPLGIQSHSSLHPNRPCLTVSQQAKLINHEWPLSASRDRSQIKLQLSDFDLDKYFSVRKWKCGMRAREVNQMCETHSQCMRSSSSALAANVC